MTITDWQFTFRCFPPHLLVTQLLHVSAQCTFGLDRTFTFLFHNHYGRTRKGVSPVNQRAGGATNLKLQCSCGLHAGANQ